MKFEVLTQTYLIYKLRELEIPYTPESDTLGVTIKIKESDLSERINVKDENGNVIDMEKFDFAFSQGFRYKGGNYVKHFPRLTFKK